MQPHPYEAQMLAFSDAYPLAVRMFDGADLFDEGAWSANADAWTYLHDEWCTANGPEFLRFWDLSCFLSAFFQSTKGGKLTLRPKFRKA